MISLPSIPILHPSVDRCRIDPLWEASGFSAFALLAEFDELDVEGVLLMFDMMPFLGTTGAFC
jgi:hypothetical protein